jgi:hypothetical protein
MNKEIAIKEKINFAKYCLRDEGYSKELITYLLSIYDLESFTNDLNKLELATHLLGHARAINNIAFNY